MTLEKQAICTWESVPPAITSCKTQPEQDLSGIVGKHIIYTYVNGWHYEYYFRNETAGDYRIASGMVADRWMCNQKLLIDSLGHGTFKVLWHEPTGTSCSLNINFEERWLHGTIIFPRWIFENPKKTVCHQNLYLDDMLRYRDQGPIYPVQIESNFAEITFIEDCGRDNDNVIACPASQLPEGYLERKN